VTDVANIIKYLSNLEHYCKYRNYYNVLMSLNYYELENLKDEAFFDVYFMEAISCLTGLYDKIDKFHSNNKEYFMTSINEINKYNRMIATLSNIKTEPTRSNVNLKSAYISIRYTNYLREYIPNFKFLYRADVSTNGFFYERYPVKTLDEKTREMFMMLFAQLVLSLITARAMSCCYIKDCDFELRYPKKSSSMFNITYNVSKNRTITIRTPCILMFMNNNGSSVSNKEENVNPIFKDELNQELIDKFIKMYAPSDMISSDTITFKSLQDAFNYVLLNLSTYPDIFNVNNCEGCIETRCKTCKFDNALESVTLSDKPPICNIKIDEAKQLETINKLINEWERNKTPVTQDSIISFVTKNIDESSLCMSFSSNKALVNAWYKLMGIYNTITKK